MVFFLLSDGFVRLVLVLAQDFIWLLFSNQSILSFMLQYNTVSSSYKSDNQLIKAKPCFQWATEQGFCSTQSNTYCFEGLSHCFANHSSSLRIFAEYSLVVGWSGLQIILLRIFVGGYFENYFPQDICWVFPVVGWWVRLMREVVAAICLLAPPLLLYLSSNSTLCAFTSQTVN